MLFEQHEIRRVYDEKTETWLFSVVNIVQVLTQQPDFQAARNYGKVLKNRLRKEGSESVTKCNRLIPSPKAEPIKLWLAKVGYERMQEMGDPARALDRAREMWQK